MMNFLYRNIKKAPILLGANNKQRSKYKRKNLLYLQYYITKIIKYSKILFNNYFLDFKLLNFYKKNIYLEYLSYFFIQ